MPPTGFDNRGRFNLGTAVAYVLTIVRHGKPLSIFTFTKTSRNEEIRDRYSNGYTIPELASLFGLSNARVHQIIHHRRN